MAIPVGAWKISPIFEGTEVLSAVGRGEVTGIDCPVRL